MTNLLFIITSILFFFWAFRNIFFWVGLWQQKEYRSDRLFAHFKETYQGRNTLFSPLQFLKWLALFGFGYVILHVDLLFPYQIFITAIFVLQNVLVGKEIFERRLKRPVLTIKTGMIVFLVSLMLVILFLFPLFERFFWILFLDRIIPFFVMFLVFLFSIPSELYRDIQTAKAIRKITEHDIKNPSGKNLMVIGVTGSYGKSSTKDYIAQVLEKKFRVAKTHGTNNTLIGVVKTVLSRIKMSTEIFVVEIGAYKIGEITQICRVVHPKIGILTAVNYQHVSLFGSVENTMKAKYELIEALPDDGLAIFNGNNENAYRLYQQTKSRKMLYQCFRSQRDMDKVQVENKNKLHGIFAYNIHAGKTSVSFDVQLRNKSFHLKTPLIGSHNVENILPAIYLGYYLGMREKEIQEAVATLTSLPKTMIRHMLKNGACVIDDTYNAGPAAVYAALSYMKLYQKKKIMVLEPLIELGKNAAEEHYTLGKQISFICDYLFLTNKNFYNAITKGVLEGNKSCVVQVVFPQIVADFIRKNTHNDDVIVFEGRTAGIVLDKLI